MTTGEKIRRLRRRHGLSQEQLADALGLTRQAVSRWETENAVPETGVIVRLSDLFGVTTDYLLKEQSSGTPGLLPEQPQPRTSPKSANLLIGVFSLTFGVLIAVAVFILSAANPWMKEGTSGVLDRHFWVQNDLVLPGVLIATAILVGIWHLGKFYFKDYDPPV